MGDPIGTDEQQKQLDKAERRLLGIQEKPTPIGNKATKKKRPKRARRKKKS
jgi:hypothetical protein